MNRRWALAIACAWAIVTLEFLAVAIANRSEFASVWEVQRGALWLAPTALGLAVPAVLLGAVWLALIERGTPALRYAAAVAVAIFGAITGWGVSAGRHFELLERRVGFVVLVAIVTGAAAYWAAPGIAAALRRRPLGAAVAAAAGVTVTELVNRFVFVRLYPAFHLALALMAIAGAAAMAAAVDRWIDRRPAAANSRSIPWLNAALVGAVVLLVLVAKPAAARLAYFDNFRLIVGDRAPLLAHAVRLAAVLSPPAPLAWQQPACAEPRCEQTAAHSGGPHFAGRDLVLVTIDALRADHVGAYGYPRPTTPHLDRLAREGVVFEHAYCPTPHTSYSVTSMMTGKYMRPLLLQGAGADSETLATILRTYGYQTAAFYPPAVFFIDRPRFEAFERSSFGFEYTKIEFIEGQGRIDQIEQFMQTRPQERPLFLWLHIFSPHEPYISHPQHDFGEKDVDRYDSEVAASDAALGGLLALLRARERQPVVIVTADHGEEFGEHGGRYHGTSVYEEQVRVPLVMWAPGLLGHRRVSEPVQTIDLVPTVLAALEIPPGPRQRGRNLGPTLISPAEGFRGLAFAETEEQTMLARGAHRLVCARKLGACQLYDLAQDPAQKRNVASDQAERFLRMKKELQALAASHGQFEREGLRAEGIGWPPAILRGVAGDADAAEDVAALLDDADHSIRRKAAEILFNLKQPEVAPALRLALSRDEDSEVRSWSALALTRIGQGASLVEELLRSESVEWRRLAALSLAEGGDARGKAILVDWWMKAGAADYERSIELLAALGKIRAKDAVWPLIQSLDSVRLRPHIARTLAAIGDKSARGPLALTLNRERNQGTRIALAEALVQLGAEHELARPLTRFLGTPDPIVGGLGYALKAGILEHVGGPSKRHLARLREEASLGTLIRLVIPPGGNGQGVRLIVRARSSTGSTAEVRVGRPPQTFAYHSKSERKRTRNLPIISGPQVIRIQLPAAEGYQELSTPVPPEFGLRAGHSVELTVFAERGVEVDALAVVPLFDELPPPAPEPWNPRRGAGIERVGSDKR